MASNDDFPTTTELPPQVSSDGSGQPDGAGHDGGVTDDGASAPAPPAKKAARKRAPRKSAARAASPAAGPTDSPTDSPPADAAESSADAAPSMPDAADPHAAEIDAADVDAAASGPAAKPAKKAARKRASRKAVVPATAPEAESEPDGAGTSSDDTTTPDPATPAPATPAPDPVASDEADEASRAAPTLPSFGVVFQAPTVPSRRRRASAPAAAPKAEVPHESDAGHEMADGPGHGLAQPTHPAAAEEAPGRDASASDDAGASSRGEDDTTDQGSEGPRRRRRRGGKGRRGRSADGEHEEDADTAETPAAQGEQAAPSSRRRRSSRDDSGSDDSSQSAASASRDDSGSDDSSQSAAAAGHDDTGHDDTGHDAGHGESSHDDTGRADTSHDDGADDEPEGEGPSRRRTRRRRRGGSSGEGDESPGVTTRVREVRRDEVTGVKGSTRLEAKKQRRREGREAGRRRTIITEAEFLARRESVERVMVVRNKDDRTQIGVLEDDVLVEHYISRETSVSMAGNIYLGRVQNVLPSMEAAFVDIGKGRNAVLYAGEVNWDAAGLEANQAKRIENALSSGSSVLVQVTKDPIGHKGARLTSQISLPGRYLVYVPNSSMTGISRKLPDTERARLKAILKEVVPASAGVIVRTAAEGASEEELRADVERLTATWEEIRAMADSSGSAKGRAKSKTATAPVLLHGEPDLTVRVIRDIFNEDFTSLVVAGEQAWSEVSDYVGSVAPDLAERITRWTSEEDLFTHYRVDEQIAKAMDRKVWLPSGGSLVIDRTEAMTVVDVNTGKFIGSGGNLEETVTKNNIEAAEEIVRQLRLRDIGGIIVIDFIDMVLEVNRDLVVRRLLECLGRDRTKHQVAEVTSLGLVQMTRKRVGSGLIEVFSENCEHCNGRGIIVHADPVDRSNGQGDAGSSGGSSASSGYAGTAGSGGAPGTRSGTSRSTRRGRSAETAAPAPAPAVPRSSGPTPAQIAAAAHAAALRAAEHGLDVIEQHGSVDLAGTSHVGSDGIPVDVAAQVEAESPVEHEIVVLTQVPPADAEVEPASDAGPADVDQSSDDHDAEAKPAEAQAGEAEVGEAHPADLRSAEPEPSRSRGRRHRGRVVAPAGPPRPVATATGGAPEGTSAAARD